MRTGMWISGAAGSGVLIARKEDGSWSPPSGLLVHTLGVGFMAGIDIYDCVIVINNRSALDAFSKVRVSLGGEISIVAGPLGVGGILESEITKDRTPVLSYVKSRGLYAGAQLDGTVIVERNDENARFYGRELPIGQILRGNVDRIPQETRMLMGVLREIDGRTDGPALESANVESKEEQIAKDRQMAEEMAEQMQYDATPPEYEDMHSTASLYSPPSPKPLESSSEKNFPLQLSPTLESTKESDSPPLPPRRPSLNDDTDNKK